MEVSNVDEVINGTLEVWKVQDVAPPTDPMDKLIWMAVHGNADIDKLERLIELKNRQEEREAKREFDEHFAKMQAKLPIITKSKPVCDDNGDVVYKYAPIDAIQKQCDPIISEHGFSYRWREEMIETGKRIILRISGYGHDEDTTFDVPPVQSNKWSNAVQAMGSMSTYGHRYTFVAGFGLTVEGEDDDGREDITLVLDNAEEFKALRECKTPEALLEVGAAIIKPVPKNSPKRKILEAEYRRLKEELSRETTN